VGFSAHASAPWLAKNSIEEIYDFWNAIKSEIEMLHTKENKANSITCSLTEITGGSSHNVTPQKCRITIDIRIPTTTTCEKVSNLIENIINKVAANKGIKAVYRVEDNTEPFEADLNSPLVRALSLSIQDVKKKDRCF
ncbi:MAG: peptidase dimerization domain-containing protein, partial [Thermoproteota archaeon]|nr:peptidase dimerization domain-containing protein [Thermoproteota archaeon]